MDNYPDTTWGGDPRAPWNKREPWEGHTCKECNYHYNIKAVGSFCLYEAMENREPTIDLTDGKNCACECFEM